MKKVLGMGNALVDILMMLKSDDLLHQLRLPKGSMQLINEAKMREIQEATILLDQHVATGGSVSNTISGLARLGVDVGFIGKIGNDSIGDFFKVDSFENGVLTYLLGSQLPSGRCHVLISPDSERTMCTYLGAASDLRATDLHERMFSDFDVLHIECYLVENRELMLRTAEMAKAANNAASRVNRASILNRRSGVTQPVSIGLAVFQTVGTHSFRCVLANPMIIVINCCSSN